MADFTIQAAHFQLPGGVEPEMHKACSTTSPLKRLTDPKHLYFPVHYSGGGPGESLVRVGQTVSQGTPIIQTESGVVHCASRAGQIVEIKHQPVLHASNDTSDTIVIETDGSHDQIHFEPLSWPWTPETLIQRALDAGIIGLGGAGFPSHQKWGTQHTLIINAAECEPYLTADDLLIRVDTQSIIRGACLLARTFEIQRIVIGIEDNKPEALDALQTAIQSARSDCHFDIIMLPTRYPSGGERQLIWLTLGEEIRSGQRPSDHGILVHNPGTLAALSRAIDGKPLTDRIVTLTGDQMHDPKNVLAPIGTPLTNLLMAGGSDPEATSSVIIGGPLMGFEVTHRDGGMTKTTNCVLVRHEIQTPPEPCIRCGACAEACPVNLQPQQLLSALEHHAFTRASHEGLTDCIECAACNTVCPSHIPLAQWFRHGRARLRSEAEEQQRADAARQRFASRAERLERLAEEQEARRTARRTQSVDALARARQAREGNPS
jgi:electron transport complex protein RnfC